MKTLLRLGLLVLLGCGTVTIAAPSTVPSGPDDRAVDALLQRVEQATRALPGFRCEASHTSISPGRTATDVAQVTFLRPNFFQVALQEGGGRRMYSVQSDGREIYTVMDKTYLRGGHVSADSSGYHWFHNDLLVLLATGSMAKVFEELPMAPRKRLMPDDTWEGASYHIVELAIGGGYPITYRMYIGADGFAHRLVQTDENNGKPLVFDSAIRALEPLTGKTAADFAFTPPADVKERDRGAVAQRGVPAAGAAAAPTGVVGAMATDFSLPTPAGERMTLAAAREGKKALLLNFWFVHCPPCRAEHPQLEKLYAELKGQGLGLLGIDDQDTPEDVTKYWTGAHLSFPTILTGPRYERDPASGRQKYGTAMLGDYASLQPYDVHECPTNILIDAEGRIVFRSSGWNEPELRAALARLGIK